MWYATLDSGVLRFTPGSETERSVGPLQLHPLTAVPVPCDGCLLEKSVVNAVMIDLRRLWSAIGTVVAQDEFLVHRRDFPGVHLPALPSVDDEPSIRGLSDLIWSAVVAVSEYQDRGLAPAGAEDSPPLLPFAEEFALNHIPRRSVLVRLGNRAAAAPEDRSHVWGQFWVVLDSEPSDSFVRIGSMSAQSAEQAQHHQELLHDVLTLKQAPSGYASHGEQ